MIDVKPRKVQVEESFELLVEPAAQLSGQISCVDVPAAKIIDIDVYGNVAIECNSEASVIGKRSIEGHCWHDRSRREWGEQLRYYILFH